MKIDRSDPETTYASIDLARDEKMAAIAFVVYAVAVVGAVFVLYLIWWQGSGRLKDFVLEHYIGIISLQHRDR